MNTPTPETDAVWEKEENILDHARNLERDRDGYRETVQLQREEIAERTRERDEALRLVVALSETARMQARITETELRKIPAANRIS